jgi:hypothetical protein
VVFPLSSYLHSTNLLSIIENNNTKKRKKYISVKPQPADVVVTPHVAFVHRNVLTTVIAENTLQMLSFVISAFILCRERLQTPLSSFHIKMSTNQECILSKQRLQYNGSKKEEEMQCGFSPLRGRRRLDPARHLSACDSSWTPHIKHCDSEQKGDLFYG